MWKFEHKYSHINDHKDILNLLNGVKKGCEHFSVLDVGASDNPWTAEVLDATLDLRPCNTPNVIHFQGNINELDGWAGVLDYVKHHGKFDFSVCSHTLEDIAYPKTALEMLPRVSKTGFISMPSHYQDFVRFEGNWPGYIHHRWLFVVRDGKLVLVPKIPFTASLQGVENPTIDRTELQIYWNGELPYEILNGDYLGPNVEYVKKMYCEILGANCA